MLESARRWAATILFNKELKTQFEVFYARPDTFSLALLGYGWRTARAAASGRTTR